MYTDINQQLDAARQDVFRLHKIEAMRKELLQGRDELEAKVVKLLIFDWIMQSKINNSRESVSRVQREVLGVIRKLREMEVHEAETVAKLKQQIKNLVMNS
ncbi:MAG: hypothetical protein FH749_14655 [Firmicutes bacterium]|nr:hypothetical protein [Bacillota bacterium]